MRIVGEPVDKIHPRLRGGAEGRDLDGDGSFARVGLVDGKGRRRRIEDVLEVDVGFDIGLVLVQIGHEEVRVRARDVGDERTLIGVDLVAVDAEGGGAAGLADIEHVLGVDVPALGLIQWVLPDHHDLGGVRIAEGHEEVAAGGRPGEAEVDLLAGRDLKTCWLRSIGSSGLVASGCSSASYWMLQNLPPLTGAAGLLEIDREGNGAGRRLAEYDVVVHRVREQKDLLAVVGGETARVTVQRAAVRIGEGEMVIPVPLMEITLSPVARRGANRAHGAPTAVSRVEKRPVASIQQRRRRLRLRGQGGSQGCSASRRFRRA